MMHGADQFPDPWVVTEDRTVGDGAQPEYDVDASDHLTRVHPPIGVAVARALAGGERR
jgi:hypothetical protein